MYNAVSFQATQISQDERYGFVKVELSNIYSYIYKLVLWIPLLVELYSLQDNNNNNNKLLSLHE
jgi:hypothetical protein